MALYERIFGLEEPKIGPHALIAACREYARAQAGDGFVTAQQVFAAFSLSTGEQAELTTLFQRVTVNGLSLEKVWDCLMLGESQKYTVAQVKSRLGV